MLDFKKLRMRRICDFTPVVLIVFLIKMLFLLLIDYLGHDLVTKANKGF